MFDQVVVGDLNAGLLESLHGALRNVYLPIITNPKAGMLPEVIMHAFVDKYHATLASVVVAVGQTKGKTTLALPPLDVSSGGKHTAASEKAEKDRVHVLESAVVLWTNRINISLSLKPESAFDKGNHPAPEACLEFWQSKTTDLGDILEQLNGPQILKVLKVLEIIRSPYFAAFKSLIASLQVAHAEAKDNVKYLAALKPNLDEFNGTDFEQVSLCIKPIMHMLLLVWKHSKFYNTPPALSLIIRMVCNAMMEKAREFTGTTDELFNLEPKEAVEKLVIVLDGCRQLKYDYYTYYNLSKTQCESNPWMADRGTMFKRFDSFITRCEDLLHLCKTVQQFEKLQVVVVGGDSGSTLTENVEGVNAAFLKIFTTIKVSAPCPHLTPMELPPTPMEPPHLTPMEPLAPSHHLWAPPL